MPLSRAYHTRAMAHHLPPRRLALGPMRSHDWKLVRAYEHLQDLDEEVARYLDLPPYVLWDEFDAERQQRVVFAQPSEPVPPRIGLLVGDCVQSVRAALDHLVYELTEANVGRPLTEEEGQRTEFPIFGPKPLSPTKSQRLLGNIDPAAKALIESRQPHLGDFNRSPLYWLHRLSNTDKHRLTPVVLLSLTGTSYSFADPCTGRQAGGRITSDNAHWMNSVQQFPGPITESKSVVLRHPEFPRFPGSAGGEVEMKVRPSFGLGFAPDLVHIEPNDVVTALQTIWHEVAHWVAPPLTRWLHTS